MKARSNIASGVFFNKNDLIRPIAIRNNDPVNIVYSSDKISLKTIGTALGAGTIGSFIKVKNNNSGAVLVGKIIDNTTVEISK